MKCEQCVKDGKRSTVTPGTSYRTAMWCPPFYDADGAYHNHDLNSTTTEMRCSEGHSWIVTMSGSCWCGWPEKVEAKNPTREAADL